MTTSTELLVVEDDRQMRRYLRALLEGHDYRVIEATTGADALRELATRPADAVLLDLGLPDGDGLELTARVREWSAVPIVVISARGREQDKVEALDAGADDYLTKPFGSDELLARIRVALRRASGAQAGTEPEFRVGDLCVDLSQRRVVREGTEIHLTPIEYRLLALLVRHAGRVVTHGQILREVWGPNSVDNSHYVRVYMAHLRRKLEDSPAQPRYLLTETGVGYRLVAQAE